MYSDHREILEYLQRNREFSYHSTLQSTLPKVLLLAAASEFEDRVCEILLQYIRDHTTDPKIVLLVEQKAVRRQYHTLFDWDTKHAGKFWSLFGPDYKDKMKRCCSDDLQLADSISAFLELGALRNRMVHNNYASFVLDKTLDEVNVLYEQGAFFVTRLPELLKLQ